MTTHLTIIFVYIVRTRQNPKKGRLQTIHDFSAVFLLYTSLMTPFFFYSIEKGKKISLSLP